MFSLDVFDGTSGFWQILLGLFMHNIPVFFLVIILWMSWKYEIVGGIAFWTGAGVYSIVNMFMNLKNIAQDKVLNYNYIITGVAVLGLILNIILLKKANKKRKN